MHVLYCDNLGEICRFQARKTYRNKFSEKSKSIKCPVLHFIHALTYLNKSYAVCPTTSTNLFICIFHEVVSVTRLDPIHRRS